MIIAVESIQIPFEAKAFRDSLLAWYDSSKRDLPWRRTRDPYAILVSELMLQQTQVKTVIPYYHRFLERFPTPAVLAEASEEDLLKQWQGLGYYRRARYLQKAAQQITAQHGGIFPDEKQAIDALPGVGAYTSAAVGSIAFDLPHAVVDGNVFRVVTRLLAMDDDISLPNTKTRIQDLSDALLSTKRPGDYNQAVMELGATVCTPRQASCGVCPVNKFCQTKQTGDPPENRPFKSRKPKVSQMDYESIFLFAENKLLLCKRPEQGLMASMWELPTQTQHDFVNWREVFDGALIHLAQLPKPVIHKFTHLHAAYYCSLYRSQTRPAWRITPSAYADHGWFTPEEVDDLPTTKVLRKTLPTLLAHLKDIPKEQLCLPLTSP